MTPGSPHSVTIGTGDDMMIDSVFLRMAGHVAMGPSGVADQSRDAMISEHFPPPVKNGGMTSVVLGDVIEERRGEESAGGIVERLYLWVDFSLQGPIEQVIRQHEKKPRR
jgi:hypothetical protein